MKPEEQVSISIEEAEKRLGVRITRQVCFTRKEAAEYTRRAYNTFADWAVRGWGPKFYRIKHPGGKKPIVTYYKDDLDAWLRGEEEGAQA